MPRYLLGLLIVFSFVLLPVGFLRAESSEVIFLMANGYYYHPVSGKMASSKELLLQELSAPPPAAPQPQTTPPAEPSPTLTAQPPAAPQSVHAFALKEAIQRAQAMLEERLKQSKEKPKTVKAAERDSAWLPITLAIWKPETNEIRLREFLKQNNKLEELDGSPVSDVRVIFSNGVSSEYAIKNSSTSVVVANIYPIFKQKTKKTYELIPVVYTPYSRNIHTQQMVISGKEYINQLIHEVYQKLRDDNIHSWRFPGKLLTEVIDPELAKSIIVIEHADNSQMNADAQRTAEAFFVKIASNEDKSYNYSRSSAGALGMVQFIPKTYAALVQKRPELGLIKDFEVGMRDPKNAVRAQVAYLDYLLIEMPEISEEQFITQKPRVHEYLIAGYNGGSGRARRAIADWDNAVSGGQQVRLAGLTKQHRALDGEIASLKKKIKATQAAATVKKLKLQLASKQEEHDRVAAQEASLKKFALPRETRQYVLKYRQALLAMQKINEIFVAFAQGGKKS